MDFNTTLISKKQQTEQVKKLQDIEFATSLDCFKDHNGFRPGELHVIVAPKGGGKSTLARTIIQDITYSEKRALVYLSEETKTNYFSPVRANLEKVFKDNEGEIEKLMDKNFVISEIETREYSEAELANWCKDFEYAIDETVADIIIFDNFSTSFLGEIHVNKQSRMFRWFKKISEKRNIPFILFIHTGKGKNTGIFDGDSVKGSSTSVNLGSYNYMLLMAGKRSGNPMSYIWVEKARYHSKAHSKVYKLTYQPEMGIFYEANKVSFLEFAEEMKQNV